MDAKIVVVIEGGVCIGVFSDPPTTVMIVDYDEIEESGESGELPTTHESYQFSEMGEELINTINGKEDDEDD